MLSRLTEKMKALPCAPECLLEIGQNQMRRVDVQLDEYDAFGVLRPMNDHDRHRALRSGWRYRLRVHIGQRDENSIMEGPVTDVDLLLPRSMRKNATKSTWWSMRKASDCCPPVSRSWSCLPG